MPKPFENCVKKGGKIRTRQVPGNKFQRICILGKKVFAGEVKKKRR